MIIDAAGRQYATVSEWWAAMERIAEERYGPVATRYPRQDEPAHRRAQNAPGLPAGPEKGTETAQLYNGISEPKPKPRRAARARSAARA